MPISERKRAYNKEYYQRRKQYFKEANKTWMRNRADWLRSLKEGKPCEDCGGVFHPVAMHWHHREGTQKEFCVGASKTLPRDRIIEEIEKCIILCANCHSVRTWA